MNDEQKHTGVARAVDKAQDAVGAAVGKASASLGGGSTGSFVKNAALGDLYEINASEIALQRTRDPVVRALAEEMIFDHRESSANLKSTLAAIQDIDPPPEELDERRNGMIDNLKAAPDGEFDKTYINQQYAAHEEATILFREYCNDGDNENLKSFAAATLPVLERHFDHVKAMRE